MTIDDLINEIADDHITRRFPEEYIRGYIHKVPESTTVDRVKFILEQSKGKKGAAHWV